MKREIYYNYYDNDNMPAVTVCLLYDGNNAARGISVWNRDEDVWNPEEGKFWAKRNAIRALKRRQLSGFVKFNVVDMLIECNCPFTQKGEFNPDLSFKEAKMLFGKPHMNDYYRRFVRATFDIEDGDSIGFQSDEDEEMAVWVTYGDRNKVLLRKDMENLEYED